MVGLLLNILGISEISDIVIKGAIFITLVLLIFVLIVTYKVFANFWHS